MPPISLPRFVIHLELVITIAPQILYFAFVFIYFVKVFKKKNSYIPVRLMRKA